MADTMSQVVYSAYKGFSIAVHACTRCNLYTLLLHWGQRPQFFLCFLLSRYEMRGLKIHFAVAVLLGLITQGLFFLMF